MLQLTAEALQNRLAEGMRSGAMSDQSAAIGRLFSGVVGTRTNTIAFEIAGGDGGAWTDDDGPIANCGSDFLMRQVSTIGGGTTEMARNVISERVLGMPRERTLDRDVPFRDVPRGASVVSAVDPSGAAGPGRYHASVPDDDVTTPPSGARPAGSAPKTRGSADELQ